MNLLQSFLIHTCIVFRGYYIFNIDSYKKACYSGLTQKLLDDVKPYYYQSKQFYITRKQSYITFTTVLRQLCKASYLPFTSKIKYSNNTYYIIYHIKRVHTDTPISDCSLNETQ